MANDNFTDREEAYRSLIEPVLIADVARELGIPVEQAHQLIQDGFLVSNSDGIVSGLALAEFLRQRRYDSGKPPA